MNGVEYVVEDTGNFAQYGVQFDVFYGDHACLLYTSIASQWEEMPTKTKFKTRSNAQGTDVYKRQPLRCWTMS